VGIAALPAAVALAETSTRVDLLEAVVGLCVAAALFGIVALALARGARERLRRTLGRAGGAGAARAGRVLGRLAVAVAVAAAIALAFYAVLDRWSQ
jgi:hypothetical protein